VEFLGVVGGVFVASGVGECVYVRLRMWRRLVSVLESGLGLDARRSIYMGELGLCLWEGHHSMRLSMMAPVACCPGRYLGTMQVLLESDLGIERT
jgi:hypothetical protein